MFKKVIYGLLIASIGAVLMTQLSSCASQKCDCPKFGGNHFHTS